MDLGGSGLVGFSFRSVGSLRGLYSNFEGFIDC